MRPKKSELDGIVEESLRAVDLWDELKDRLDRSALDLTLEQKQRLCIARLVAVKSEVLLMDEPCSALDPIATLRIEELMRPPDAITRSSSSPTTCSRPPASRTRRGSCSSASSSSSARRRNLHPAPGQTDRGLYHREIRVSGRTGPFSSTRESRSRPRRRRTPDLR